LSWLIAFLVVVPLLVGVILAFVKTGTTRNSLVVAASVLIAAGSIATALVFGNGSIVFFGPPGDLEPGPALLAAEGVIAFVVVAISLQQGRRLAPVLAIAQLAIAGWLEVSGRLPVVDPDRLFGFDRLSMVLVLIVGIIGTLICVHALGYMRDYQRTYPQTRGRRRAFFPLLFVFLSAMFGLVSANYLPLLLVFWEVTTLCSFLLIGYSRTGETIGYAFRALNMNLLGGLSFSLAIAVLAGEPDGLDLARLTAGPAAAAYLPAIALLALAGITKSAQLPFSSWLLGAMHAPAPTSALLHSSTMVKAGVFLLLRLSPAMAGSAVGDLVAFTGLLTFLFVSIVATTEQNTKIVLAYSTIGTLGLIVGCAGIGGAQLAWVGVMLIVFHAVAKSLLFLVVGTLENRLYTKDMEHFDALLSRMPRLSTLALTGIAGMFLAPFGIVLAKWSAIRAFLEVPGWQGATTVLILAFGSAVTIFYWGKLLIKVLSTQAVDAYHRSVEARVTRFEWFAEVAHAVLVVLVAASLGWLSEWVVAPYARALFPGDTGALLHVDPAVVPLLVLTVLCLPALAMWSWRQHTYDVGDFYASGRTTDCEHAIAAALGGSRAVALRNYYLVGVVNGDAVFQAGVVVGGALLAAMLVAGTVIRA
jgi:ech hydrogenase subunit A